MEVIESNQTIITDTDTQNKVDKNSPVVKLAKKRVAFKKHLMSYLLSIGLMWFIWLLSGTGYPWPIWVMAGWGFAVFSQYVKVYKEGTLFSVEEEIKQIEKELDNR